MLKNLTKYFLLPNFLLFVIVSLYNNKMFKLFHHSTIRPHSLSSGQAMYEYEGQHLPLYSPPLRPIASESVNSLYTFILRYSAFWGFLAFALSCFHFGYSLSTRKRAKNTHARLYRSDPQKCQNFLEIFFV